MINIRQIFVLFFFTMGSIQASGSQAVNTDILYDNGYQCPTAHSEYKLALAELKGLKTKLAELECQGQAVDQELSALVNLVSTDRKKFLKIIAEHQGKTLSAENAKSVQQYSANVTETVAGLISLINPTDTRPGFFSKLMSPGKTCSMDEESRYAVISKTASLVYEATSLLSKVAGPYGVPISIGGTLLSGFLQGMSKHMSGSSKINFDDENKRLFFAESLCLYHQYDNEVRQLLNPEPHLAALKEMENFLVLKLEDLQDTCESCADLIENYTPPEEEEPEISFGIEEDRKKNPLASLLERFVLGCG